MKKLFSTCFAWGFNVSIEIAKNYTLSVGLQTHNLFNLRLQSQKFILKVSSIDFVTSDAYDNKILNNAHYMHYWIVNWNSSKSEKFW